uniref:COMM domain-containing protein 3 n=1 Tax=Phaeomonas parva TaxID=124430 RepID=A0A7S1XW81_9STRA
METALAPLTLVDAEEWKELLGLGFREAAVERDAEDAGLGARLVEVVGSDEAQAAHLALVALIVDAVRTGLAEDQLRGNLEELGFGEGHIAAFLETLGRARPTLQRGLGSIGIAFDAIVDIDWRLDYTVRSSAGGSVHEPFYFVSLKTRTPGGDLSSVEFTCNLEQLQDLYAKVQDATKQVSRILTGQADA